jgi:hypothetical protein
MALRMGPDYEDEFYCLDCNRFVGDTEFRANHSYHQAIGTGKRILKPTERQGGVA